MATYRNTAGEPRFVPLVERVIEDGDTFDVPDEIAANLAFSPEIFAEVVPPKSAAKKPATPKEK